MHQLFGVTFVLYIWLAVATASERPLSGSSSGSNRRTRRDTVFIPPLVLGRPPLVQRSSMDLPPLVAPRQIFSPRMGKDIDSSSQQEALGRYARLPPLPKLDKAFDQYLSQYRRDANGDSDDDLQLLRQLLLSRLRHEHAGQDAQAPHDGYNSWPSSSSPSGATDDDQSAPVFKRSASAHKENDGDDELAATGGRHNLPLGDKRSMSMLRMGRSLPDADRRLKRNVRMMRMG